MFSSPYLVAFVLAAAALVHALPQNAPANTTDLFGVQVFKEDGTSLSMQLKDGTCVPFSYAWTLDHVTNVEPAAGVQCSIYSDPACPTNAAFVVKGSAGKTDLGDAGFKASAIAISCTKEASVNHETTVTVAFCIGDTMCKTRDIPAQQCVTFNLPYLNAITSVNVNDNGQCKVYPSAGCISNQGSASITKTVPLRFNMLPTAGMECAPPAPVIVPPTASGPTAPEAPPAPSAPELDTSPRPPAW